MKVLVVEDEAMLREGLVDLLEGAGHEVVAVADGLEGATVGAAERFDMVLLDLTLPRLDGLEVCRRLRLARPSLPVLMLTARAGELDKVEGLRIGADDYVTKPFSPRELLARLQAFERRLAAVPAAPDELASDGCRFDLGRCLAWRDGAEIVLTAREVGLLRWLSRHARRAVSRAELLEHVWGLSRNMETRTIDVTIANLRKKIERDPKHPRIVVSVKGVGYAWGDGMRHEDGHEVEA
ncbi:MAG: response regulator transcription factor [Deltaproteobacteria bacterium]|nr:response regulator transcription factor [Deltaproteobacteria bacterium]